MSFLYVLYCVFVDFVYVCLCCLSPFFPSSIGAFCKQRRLDPNLLKKIRSQMGDKQSILFYCSSAGEYEQACPLIEEYKKQGYYICVILFSMSGIKFIKQRDESDIYFLSPLDRYANWIKIFKALSPTLTFIVRHELWPSFINVASNYSSIILINASINKKYNKFYLFIKKFLLSFMDMIFVVDAKDFDFFKSICQETYLIGDTKYDRVRQRMELKQDHVSDLKQELFSYDSLHTNQDRTKYLIIGSAWHKDIEYIFESYTRIRKLDPTWKIICASHDIGFKMIEYVIGQANNKNLSYVLYSQWLKTKSSSFNLMIVDTLGVLSDLYGVASLAWVGGACHYKIHNVLEPAIYGLDIAHGPMYLDQKEAVLLVQNGLSTVCNCQEDVDKWWSSHLDPKPNQATKDLMFSLSFTSQKIINQVKQLLLK